MRLRVDDVEIFGQSEEEYQRWVEHLKQHNLALQVPSPAWARVSVLAIAASVNCAFRDLREHGHEDVYSLDCVIHMERQDDGVAVHVGRAGERVGRVPYTELYDAFTPFAERVRRDYLSVCPQLADHPTLGPWFRGEAEGPLAPQPPDVILL